MNFSCGSEIGETGIDRGVLCETYVEFVGSTKLFLIGYRKNGVKVGFCMLFLTVIFDRLCLQYQVCYARLVQRKD